MTRDSEGGRAGLRPAVWESRTLKTQAASTLAQLVF